MANAAIAVVALVTAGVDPAAAAAGVAACPGVPGRMERVDAGQPTLLALVDYAHSPDALRAAARHLRASWPAGTGCSSWSAAAATGTRTSGR